MYEDPVVKGIDYYSLIMDETSEFRNFDVLNRYRTIMTVYFRKFIDEVKEKSSVERKQKLDDWFDFNKDFIGFMKNSELIEDLEGILFDFGNR